MSLCYYLDAFSPCFNRCLKAGTVNKLLKGFYLIKGLNKPRLIKVLNKFNLSLSSLLDIDFSVLKPFLIKIAIREAEIKAFNLALSKTKTTASTKQPNAKVLLGLATYAFRAP